VKQSTNLVVRVQAVQAAQAARLVVLRVKTRATNRRTVKPWTLISRKIKATRNNRATQLPVLGIFGLIRRNEKLRAINPIDSYFVVLFSPKLLIAAECRTLRYCRSVALSTPTNSPLFISSAAVGDCVRYSLLSNALV